MDDIREAIQVRVNVYLDAIERGETLTSYEKGRYTAFLLVLGKIDHGADWIDNE